MEGAKQPFVVWADHKNLTHLQNAKRLNFHQAHWSLFYGSFPFSTSYHPGTCNVKPGALSRQFTSDEESEDPARILPSTCQVGGVSRQVENEIRQGLATDPDPGNGLHGHRFVPSAACSAIIYWAHTLHRTIALLQYYFCWPQCCQVYDNYRICTIILPCVRCTINNPKKGPNIR